MTFLAGATHETLRNLHPYLNTGQRSNSFDCCGLAQSPLSPQQERDRVRALSDGGQ
ncbi:MAG: hypothetical protein HYX94_05680 [Chloroflexi bacterium]|nr:hypothetical protein [Chloroflexota bacterium]